MNLLGVPWQVHATVVPVHDGVSTTVTTVPTDVPAALPPIHFWARDARLGEAELGEIRIETYPQGAGMHLERIEANSPNLELRGRGDWPACARATFRSWCRARTIASPCCSGARTVTSTTSRAAGASASRRGLTGCRASRGTSGSGWANVACLATWSTSH